MNRFRRKKFIYLSKLLLLVPFEALLSLMLIPMRTHCQQTVCTEWHSVQQVDSKGKIIVS